MLLWAQCFYEHSWLQLHHCSRFILTLCKHCLQILWLGTLPGLHLDDQCYHRKAVVFSVLSSFLLKGICNHLLKAIMNLLLHKLSLGTDMTPFSSWGMREGMHNWASEPASQVIGFWDNNCILVWKWEENSSVHLRLTEEEGLEVHSLTHMRYCAALYLSLVLNTFLQYRHVILFLIWQNRKICH